MRVFCNCSLQIVQLESCIPAVRHMTDRELACPPNPPQLPCSRIAFVLAVEQPSVHLRQSDITLHQFRRALKTLFVWLTETPAPSDLFLVCYTDALTYLLSLSPELQTVAHVSPKALPKNRGVATGWTGEGDMSIPLLPGVVLEIDANQSLEFLRGGEG